MGKFDGVLLVCDFDDTVYTADCRIPERNRTALAYFEAEGGRFTIATGRAWRTFSPYVHLLPINAPVIEPRPPTMTIAMNQIEWNSVN